jgi:hypothetical protein
VSSIGCLPTGRRGYLQATQKVGRCGDAGGREDGAGRGPAGGGESGAARALAGGGEARAGVGTCHRREAGRRRAVARRSTAGCVNSLAVVVGFGAMGMPACGQFGNTMGLGCFFYFIYRSAPPILEDMYRILFYHQLQNSLTLYIYIY